jgi:glycosyltransferase involved in cell wall biosynthesis
MGTPRVLILSRNLSLLGGISRVFLTFARHFNREQLHVRMGSVMLLEPAVREVFLQTGLPLHELGDEGYVRPALALRKIIKKQAIDMVIATSLKAYLVAKLAATPKCRVLYWIHAIALVTESRLKVAVYRWAARRDTLIYISERVKKVHSYRGHTGRELVLLNGVEDVLDSGSLYDYGQRQALGIPRSALVIGYTAVFIPWKEHKTLLAAFAKLAAEFPDMHLVLLSTGELFESTRAMAREICGGDRIHFLGLRTDARQLLGIMDIYAQPSNGEGISIAVLEAMMAERAIVVSDAGALPDIIDDGDTGLICRVLDAGDLADKIGTLARDSELRRRLGARARQVALDRFGGSRFVERLTWIVESEGH